MSEVVSLVGVEVRLLELSVAGVRKVLVLSIDDFALIELLILLNLVDDSLRILISIQNLPVLGLASSVTLGWEAHHVSL